MKMGVLECLIKKKRKSRLETTRSKCGDYDNLMNGNDRNISQ